MPDPNPRPPRRAAVLFVSEDQLAALLRLPDDWTVQSVRDDWARNGVMIRIAGPGLPTYVPGSEPYRLDNLSLRYVPPAGDAPANAAGTLHVILPADWEQEIPPD